MLWLRSSERGDNKNLQESVEPLIDHIKTLGDSIQIATGVLPTLTTQSQPEKRGSAGAEDARDRVRRLPRPQGRAVPRRP